MAGTVSRWRTVLVTVIVAYALLILVGIGFIYSGTYDIGADTHHWGLTYHVFEMARVRSIKAHASGIAVPADLNDPTKAVAGVSHYAEHCAVCHGAPGVERGDLAEGLYPRPPNLAHAAQFYTPGELFWIVKHGIKMTGMPSWADHSDDELWATVVFLRELVEMSPQDYAKLIAASRAQGGHRHDVQEPQPAPAPQPADKDHEHPAGHQH
jgi:mono/diheme cytochrome c family protein